MFYDVCGYKVDLVNVFIILFKVEYYKCFVLIYFYVFSLYEYNCIFLKDILFYLKWMFVGLV